MGPEAVDALVRLTLREDINCFLQNEEMEVYLGYDYLMGIHTSKSIASIIPSIEKNGLFVTKTNE